MKKDELVRINNYILKNLDVFMDVEADAYWKFDNVRLRYCSAYVYETPDFIVLRSYNTVVAFINKHTGEFFDVLRYFYVFTSVSAQHIAKFRSDYWNYSNKYYSYYPTT